jgi:trk system potassium uptake protein TrkA
MGRFAVIGLGYFGQNLARELAALGNEVLAIDNDMREVEGIKDDVATAVRLDSTDERAMRQQGLEDMDAVVVSLLDFETSVHTSVLLQQLGVRRIIARTMSPLHDRMVKLLGIRETIFPEQEVARSLAKELSLKGVMDYVGLGGEYTVAAIRAPARFAGKTLQELDLRKRHALNIVTIKRIVTERSVLGQESSVEKVLGIPAPETRVEAGDVLVVMGKEGDIQALL